MIEPGARTMPPRTLEELIEQARSRGRVHMVVAGADDSLALSAVAKAVGLALIDAVLVGDEARIREAAAEADVSLDHLSLVQADDETSAATAVRMVHNGWGDLLMKGLLPTKALLHAVLNRESGLCVRGLLSHVAVFEAPSRQGLVLLTDAAVNVNPRFDRKMEIVANAVETAHRLGFSRPKVAILAAVEKVDLPAMRATVDAEMLRRLGEAGYFGDCLVAGPIALDVAISPECASHKAASDPVAGVADVLVAPNIETANALYKAITCIAGKDVGGVVVGAEVPVVVPSRADTGRSKLCGIALGALLSRGSRGEPA